MSKKKKYSLISALLIICIVFVLFIIFPPSHLQNETTPQSGLEIKFIELPEPRYDSETSVEKALLERRSIRDYNEASLSLTEISQLLWAAQGITNTRGFRTAPSAGALYPLELFLVVGNVDNLPAGVYRYLPDGHKLEKVLDEDKRNELYDVSLSQSSLRDAAVVLVFSAVYDRITVKYGERGIRYVYIEVGHAAENVFLQTVSLNLSAVIIGAFHDEEVQKVLGLKDDEQPLLLMPIGKD
ncbi:MAG: SagB/ThcOx family dehydrogenase [Ignavibacteria bacterium]|nr:SagB/ThcOx family dehydrogenase [Bacteroidota bacterium]MBL7128065.1 SagB/ThcOx family dehydrogenase [Ignavibacteria bacterium]